MAKKKNLQSRENLIYFIDDGFLQADADGIITNANIAIADMCGYKSPEEMIGLPMKSLYANETDSKKMMETIKKQEKLTNFELELKTKSGKRFWSLSNIKLLFDDKNRFLGTEGVIRNITERKQMEEELRSANQQLAATEEELRANNQQLEAIEQQLRAGNQQMSAMEQQLRASNQHLLASREEIKGQLEKSERQRKANLVVLGDLNKATKALKEARDKAQRYLDVAGVMFLMINASGEVALINQKGAEILGYKPEDIIGKNWFDHFLPADNRAEVKSIFKQIVDGKLEELEYHENTVLTGNGQEKVIAWHNTILKDEKGKVIGSLSSGEDITERKLTEAALRESEEKFRSLFNQSPLSIYIHDLNGHIVDTNPIAREQLEYTKQELEKLSVFDLHPQNRESINLPKEEILKQWKSWKPGDIHTIMADHQRKDGTVFPAEVSTGRVQFVENHLILSLVQDITERKKIQEELRKSEEKHRLLFEYAGVGIGYFTLDGKVVSFNQKACEFLNGKPDDFIGKSFTELFGKKSGEQYLKRITMVSKSDEPLTFEDQLRLPSGKKWFRSTYSRIKDSDGTVIGVQTISDDISEIKDIEAGLISTKAELQSLLATTEIAFILIKPDYAIQTFNRVAATNVKTIFNKKLRPGNSILDYTLPHTRSGLISNFAKTLKGEVITLDYPFPTKDTVRWYNFTYVPVKDASGKITGVLFSSLDITDRKQAEEKLLKNQYYLKKAQEIGAIGTWELDLQKNILIWTEENYKIFGIPPGTDMNFELFLECVHPDDRDYVNEEWKKGIETKSYDIEHRLLLDGKIKWVREKAEIRYDDRDQPIKAIGFSQDITGQKLSEKQLQESEARYRSVYQTAPMAFAVWTPDTKLIDWNEEAEHIFGWKKQDVIGKSFFEIIIPDVAEEQVRAAVDSIIAGNVEKQIVNQNITKDGRMIWCAWSNAAVPGADGTVQYVISLALDITQQKEADQRLKEKMAELARTNRLMIGREHRMIDLKQEVNEFCEKLGLPKKYSAPEEA